jgi:hypothetical protein
MADLGNIDATYGAENELVVEFVSNMVDMDENGFLGVLVLTGLAPQMTGLRYLALTLLAVTNYFSHTFSTTTSNVFHLPSV